MPAHKVMNTVKVAEQVRVKYKDIFELREFYKSLREWFLDRQWGDEEEKTEHWETYYGERINQSGAKEIWFQWRLLKQPEHAPFLKYYLDLDFHCLAITDTEILRDGMKLKVNKGEIEIIIKPFIEKVYESKFAENALLKHLTNLFSTRVYRRDLEQRKKELYQETYELQNWIKHWFKLKRYLPYEESKSFFLPQAYPSHIKG